MNQEQNSFNQNNMMNNGIDNNQPLNNLNKNFNNGMNQVPQQNINNNVEVNMNNKPSKNFKLPLFIGIGAAIAVIVVAVVLGFSSSSSKGKTGDKETGTNVKENLEEEEKMTAAGKIPYNSESNSCALSFLEYKDNTRDLCSTGSYWYSEKGNLNSRYINYTEFSFYLNADESNILSYKWKDNDEAVFQFLSAFLDESNNYYIYLFWDVRHSGYVYLSSPVVDKYAKAANFSNATTITLQDGTKIEKGSSNVGGGVGVAKHSAYRINKELNDLEYSLVYVGVNDEEDANKYLSDFNKFLSLDNGAPFVYDLIITKKSSNEYYVKSYKYVYSLSTEYSYRGGYGDLNYNLSNSGIVYTFSDYYTYATNDTDKYEVYQTEWFASKSKMWSSYITDEDVFSIAMGYDNGFYVYKPDMSLGSMYYINNFTPMFVTKDNQGFGETFKYIKQ